MNEHSDVKVCGIVYELTPEYSAPWETSATLYHGQSLIFISQSNLGSGSKVELYLTREEIANLAKASSLGDGKKTNETPDDNIRRAIAEYAEYGPSLGIVDFGHGNRRAQKPGEA